MRSIATRSSRRVLSALAATLLLGAAAGAGAAPAVAAGCDRYASPHGDRHARGTFDDPLRSVGRLVRALDPGEVGCLRAGTYDEDVSIARGGRQGRPITLTSAPGSRATLRGRLSVEGSATDVVVRGLWLDGRNRRQLPSPTVNGKRILFEGNDVTNRSSAICFILGTRGYGRAQSVTLRRNRVHHCGRLPATNHDHGIYVSWAVDTAITGNWIHDNADRGVQLYADAQRTRIVGNVIDGNGVGVIISGDFGVASNDTLVTRNVIANSRVRANVESYWPPRNPLGRNNVVRGNCVYGTDPNIDLIMGGFSAYSNVIAAPVYVNRARGDLRLRGGNRCATVASVASFTTAAGSRGVVPGPPAGARAAAEKLAGVVGAALTRLLG